MELYYSYYLSFGHYKKRTPNINASTRGITKLTLLRSAVIVGLATKGYQHLALEVKEWKIKTITTFIDTDTTPFTIKNINHLETSEKMTVAYFIGMVFAHLHMEKYYGIRHLEHLKNPGICPVPYGISKKRPDLWGFNRKTNKSYLVEAKGSTTPDDFFENGKIKDAMQQLKTIKEIRYITTPKDIIFNKSLGNLDKLIIATHPNIHNEVTQQVIDPTEEEEAVITINADESVFKYYYNLVMWLRSVKPEKNSINLNGERFEFLTLQIESLECSIGILEPIFDYINEIVNDDMRYRKEDFEGSYEIINNILDKYEISEDFSESFSIGNDGVIVLENNH